MSIERAFKVEKTYNFRDDKTNVHLDFKLDVQNKKELKAFREILLAAEAAVSQDIGATE